MITCGSLFTGIGGIDLAFVRAGFDIRWQVEIDPFCRKILAKHHDYWPRAVPDRTSRLKALGNAVVPRVIYPIAVRIRERIENGQRAD